MLVNAETIDLTFRGFKAVFTDAFMEAPANSDKTVMKVPSSGRDETNGWLGQFPTLREWVGPRQVKNFEAHSFTIKNRKFESTLSVGRDVIADDKIGDFKPMFSEMGQAARRHPEELVFSLLKAGFAAACYDGQYFFDTDHPVTDADGKTEVIAGLRTSC